MMDIGLFVAQGWRNIWKQLGILLFSAMVSVGIAVVALSTALAGRFYRGAAVLALLLELGGLFAFFYCLVAGQAGAMFTAYSVAHGERTSIAATWAVVQRSWRKVFLLYCIYAACVLPFICVIAVYSASKPSQPARAEHLSWLLGMAISAIGSLLAFWLAGIVAHGMGIRESFRKGWPRFFRYFWPLACTGVLLYAGWYLIDLGISIIALFLKSGFDSAVLRTIDYLAPASSLGSYIPYQFMRAVAGTVFWAVSAAAFMVAYVKYARPGQHLSGSDATLDPLPSSPK